MTQGTTPRHQKAKLDMGTGLYLMHGNGCHLHPNCFTCKLPDSCSYLSYLDQKKGKVKSETVSS